MPRALRGKSMPVDAVVYTTVLTLVIFLLFRLPFLWNGVNFDKGSDKTSHMAGGAAAILSITIVQCFLHGWLKIRERAKHLEQWFAEISQRVWDAYHAPDRQSFSQCMDSLKACARSS